MREATGNRRLIKCPTNTILIRLVLIAIPCLMVTVLAQQNVNALLELAEQRYGPQARQVVADWGALMKDMQKKEERAKLVAINDFFNSKVKFSDDKAIWGDNDYWATPLETLGMGQGDCEDFSIAKYISLLKTGVPLNKLRLIYVKAKMANGRSQAHMVLAYYPKPNSDPLVLDNLSTEILPASKRRDLTPVFSFNSAGLWVGGSTEPKVKKPETRLSRWRDVLLRMQSEGIK